MTPLSLTSESMFPECCRNLPAQFVDAHTAGVRVKADLAGNPCHDAMNKKAMVAWKDALESFKHNSKVITNDCHGVPLIATD